MSCQNPILTGVDNFFRFHRGKILFSIIIDFHRGLSKVGKFTGVHQGGVKSVDFPPPGVGFHRVCVTGVYRRYLPGGRFCGAGI